MEGKSYGSTLVDSSASKSHASSSSTNVPQQKQGRALQQGSLVDLSLWEEPNTALFYNWYMMYRYKVELCKDERQHPWHACHYKHLGESSFGRRDPKRSAYEATMCRYFQAPGNDCWKGDTCKFSHSCYEKFLHPKRYRTAICKDQESCNRRFCVFVHKEEELRLPNQDWLFPSSPPRITRSMPVRNSENM